MASRPAAIRELFRDAPGAQRAFVGRTVAGEVTVTLSDPQGRPRLRMGVDAAGTPRLDFLDPQGSVIYSLPPAGAATT